MMKADLIIKNAAQLLTLAGSELPRTGIEMDNLAIINDGALAIKDGRITEVGKSSDIIEKWTSNEVIDAYHKVVMPGFIDSHTHPVFCQTRENEFEMRIKGKSYVEISQSGGGIRASIRAVRDATEDQLYELSLKRIENLISNGITTLEAKSGYGLDTESEMKMLRVIKRLDDSMPIEIVPTFMGAHEYPAEYKNNHRDYIEILKKEMIPAVAESNLAEFIDIFTEAHVFNIEESREILLYGKDYGLKIKMHADELEPIGGAELAAELGAVSADHLGATSDKGIRALAEKGVIATLLPGTLFSLGKKEYARARDMIREGIAVALATDYNPGSCNCDSMQFILSLATLQMKMTIAEAITSATINAAHALSRGTSTGSLETGKFADLLIFDIPSYQFIPYHLGSSSIESVIKKGKVIFNRKNVILY